MSDTVHQALISHVGMNRLDLTPTTSLLRYCVAVYTYAITGYHTPQKLGNVVWYVPAASAPHLSTHSQLT